MASIEPGPDSMKIQPIVILAALVMNVLPATAAGTDKPAAAGTPAAPRDGQHDFDWEIGTWDTQLKRLREPLSGKSEWVEYAGTSVIKSVIGKRANMVELDVHGGAGRIVGVSLRLYQPASGQWTLNFANLSDGMMTDPMHGSFNQGLGTFYGQDTVNGRKVFVRFLIIPVSRDQWRFEQACSADGGKTWENNWIAIDTRRKDPPA
ncbi:MAG: hypothetical protein ACJ8LG_18165 [Massilia sp.]